jgi:DNA-binding transcriptional LysR family regulator
MAPSQMMYPGCAAVTARAPAVSAPGGRGRLLGAIDDALAERGLSRRVVASLPTSSAGLDLVARTDLATTVAERVCRPIWSRLGLIVRPLPFPVPPVPVIITWLGSEDEPSAQAMGEAQ